MPRRRRTGTPAAVRHQERIAVEPQPAAERHVPEADHILRIKSLIVIQTVSAERIRLRIIAVEDAETQDPVRLNGVPELLVERRIAELAACFPFVPAIVPRQAR